MAGHFALARGAVKRLTRLVKNKTNTLGRNPMRRDRVLWALTSVCVAMLIAPALWNGFPLLQYDTGGYLARWYEGYLVPSRSAVYGLILACRRAARISGRWWSCKRR